jgi:hypothetical protein
MACSLAEPSPIRSPMMTDPVAMPIRADCDPAAHGAFGVVLGGVRIAEIG